MCADGRPSFLHAATAVSWQHGNAVVCPTMCADGRLTFLHAAMTLQCHGSTTLPLPTLCLIMFVDGLQHLDTVK
jgi:hypothetical protein